MSLTICYGKLECILHFCIQNTFNLSVFKSIRKSEYNNVFEHYSNGSNLFGF